MSSPLRVAIVGAGNGGPALALALRAQGHAVEILERVPDPAPVGAGILLQPTGLTALAELDALGPVAAAGAPVRRLVGRTRQGRTVMDLAYDELAPGMLGLGVHRGVVAGTLLTRAVAAGAVLRDGVEVTDVRPDGRLVADGATTAPYDLVVCADGARSTLRTAPSLPAAVRGLTRRAARYPWGALWFLARDPDGAFGDVLDQTYRGTGQMLGFLPTGRGPDGDGPLVSLFWSVRLSAVAALQAAGLATWKDRVLALQPRAAPLLDQLDDLDQLLLAPYFDVRMRRWHAVLPGGTGLCFLGDAAHAMSPQLGQGTNLALLDAVTLARALQGADRAALPERLAGWSRDRARHLRFYQWASYLLTPVFQSGLPLVGPLRDLLFGPLGRVPFVRRRMLDSLAGVRTGPFSTLPLDRFPAWRQLLGPTTSPPLDAPPVEPRPGTA